MKRKNRAEFRKGVDTVIMGFIEKMREDGHKSWRGAQLLGLAGVDNGHKSCTCSN